MSRSYLPCERSTLWVYIFSQIFHHHTGVKLSKEIKLCFIPISFMPLLPLFYTNKFKQYHDWACYNFRSLSSARTSPVTWSATLTGPPRWRTRASTLSRERKWFFLKMTSCPSSPVETSIQMLSIIFAHGSKRYGALHKLRNAIGGGGGGVEEVLCQG